MLNGRHHLLDVVTGAVIGFVEGSLVISALWMSSEKAENILKLIYYDQDN
jgi:membrane-associated phospholipid phosphatase